MSRPELGYEFAGQECTSADGEFGISPAILPSRTPFGPAPWRAWPAGANGRRAAGVRGRNGVDAGTCVGQSGDWLS